MDCFWESQVERNGAGKRGVRDLDGRVLLQFGKMVEVIRNSRRSASSTGRFTCVGDFVVCFIAFFFVQIRFQICRSLGRKSLILSIAVPEPDSRMLQHLWVWYLLVNFLYS